MNVLVYSGPEILQTSLNHALTSLKSILVPHYTVQPITQNTLTTQPWQKSCALLVLPRSRHRFVSVTSKHIKEFVEAGGAYLMLGTGASAIPRSGGLGSGSTGLSLGLEAGETPLKFYDKFNNCYIICDDDAIEGRVEPRVVALRSSDGELVNGIFDTEAAEFKGFEKIKRVSILAQYQNGGAGSIAGLALGVSKGRIAFWAPSIEYPLAEPPASSTITDQIKISADEVKAFDTIRLKLISATLTQLGLQVPQETTTQKLMISRPLPQFLISTPDEPTIVSLITDAIAAPHSGMQLTTLKDANDELHFHSLQESRELLKSARELAQTPSDPSTWQPKHIIICRDGVLPDRELTPLFDLGFFYKSLSSARIKQGHPRSTKPWGMGEALLYGEATTLPLIRYKLKPFISRNPHLLAHLPTPLLSLASHQLVGRGRGSNVWLSPSGCLQFSLLLRVSLADLPATKLVFLQYLFALAVVEACRDESVLGPVLGEMIRLKWPNDIYASVGTEKEDLRKIGGILVTTSFTGGKIDIVIGSGLNVLNVPPITSLSQLQPAVATKLSMERTAAAIMAKFEPMWTTFIQERGSFEPFMDLYLQRWLHSDQLVTLTTTTPHIAVRIAGITPDHGLLRTIPERSGMRGLPSSREGEYIDLRPDGNSFDLMSNLIKSKS
ncbi:hypothetical protein GALMADRAFT_246358 [Galerina marginata CBS 339.88]|uniref:BPL/LPL catalytic domain-containing protein n=1 Tax=Galerina marginata (strain CBS 339.88) TaxID=685588 RepID=A0A067TDS4_GALM3|nr:hypothetical protein GALMADRAFT_246358 [Galerina marginata CBS 339.88]